MLVFQHNEICAFPSEHFYDGNLKSPLPSAYVKPSMMVQRVRIDQTRYKQEVNIWPNSHVPLVFCHVEGAEKTLSVSTAEGNEQSKSNEFERDHAVSACICRCVIRPMKMVLNFSWFMYIFKLEY